MAGRSILTPQSKPSSTLKLSLGPVGGAFVRAVQDGLASEYAICGPRGEAKTQDTLIAIALHGSRHAELGFATPARWMYVADTFRTHITKTHVSMLYPF